MPNLSTSALNKVSNLLYEFSIPVGLSYILQAIIASTQNDPNTPQIPIMRAPREWFSQPRPCTDVVIEVLTVNLRQPSTVASLAFEVLQVPCQVEAWYRDRNNHWVPLTDTSHNSVTVNVNYSATTNWYSFKANLTAVVAKAVQLRIMRNANAKPQMGTNPYVVGIKELLISRTIFDIHDTPMAIEGSQDSMGNTITSYVKHWQPGNAIDNDPSTYWKSFPCPDPMGVVSYYMDVRDSSGNPQLIDTLFIDPVYAGNSLNVYYSTDTTQGTLAINPISLKPKVSVNAIWTAGVGLEDTSPVGGEFAQLLFHTAFGPLIEEPIWIGLQWTPNFSAAAPPSSNPILFSVAPGVDAVQSVTINGNPTGGTWTLTDWTNHTTTALAYNASASAVQSALQALTAIGSGNVQVYAEANGGPYFITFIGSRGMQEITDLKANAAALTGGTDMNIKVLTTTLGSPPPNPITGLHWPTVHYDTGAGTFVVTFTDGTTSHTYDTPISPSLQKDVDYEIVVGWSYNPSVVFLSVTQQNGTVVGSATYDPATNLPNNIILDGEVGYINHCGRMTALVVKNDLWSNGFEAFQSAAAIYANPGPVHPDSTGTYPSTSLDNAILACDWTSQEYPVGGASESWYENKVWTPVFANYVTQRGNLFFPQKVSASFLKLEFYNLTPEPYPVYDQGITVTYDTFPISVLSTGQGPASSSGQTNSPLTLGSDVITSSIGSVNWFNPSTIQNAINSNWGITQPAVPVISGPGTLSQSLPNITQSNITASYRQEKSNPWIYRRQMPNPAFLAGQQLTQQATGSPHQLLQSHLSASAPAIGSGTNGATSSGTNTVTGSLSTNNNASSQVIAGNFSPVTTTSNSNVLAQMGANWWLFPGANLKMPAGLMQQMTGTSTVVGRGPSSASRFRFTTSSVHRYTKKSLALDAPVAYFAGLAEVQAYSTAYISSNDPPSFAYSQYDPATFVYSNINQVATGPLTTKGSKYQLANPDFLYPLELSPWTATGNWYWDSQNGIGSNDTSGGVSCAALIADGNPNTLISEPIAVSPGDQILVTAFVAYYNAVSTAGGQLSISLVTYNSGTPTTTALAMPSTTATYTVANRAAMLALAATQYQSCTITNAAGGDQGTYILMTSDPTVFANWAFTGYGTYVNQPTGNIDGRLFIPLNGIYTVPGSGVDHVAVSLNVNGQVTAGNTYWGDVSINPAAGIEGTVFLNAVTTSNFADVTVNVSDSGLLRSDSMWARQDPLDTNISDLALAPYVTTIPNIIPAGNWGDTFATWEDLNIDWGEPVSEVAIQVDPNIIYNGNRAMHFTRATGAGEAGIQVKQQTNLLPQELCQIGCVFFKTTPNANQITLNLIRVSDGVVAYTETFTPVVGYWFTHLSAFFELPNTWDQVYTVEFLATGDAADDIYLADVFLNVAGIRYFLQLGSGFLFDVTPLAYGGYANVSCTVPVSEFSLTVGIFNPDAWAYGIALTPHYLGR